MEEKPKLVSDVGERELIKLISKIIGGLGNDTLLGEDDAVSVSLTENNSNSLIINNDMLVSTTDVPEQMTYYEAGIKAVVMTVSDILVKGATPKWGIIALGIPNDLEIEGENGFTGLITGLNDAFNEYGVKYLGGDLNESKEIIISCTIFGEIEKNKAIPRSGAKPGDLIFSTGEFGRTGCGFAILLKEKDSDTIPLEWRENFINSILKPKTAVGYGNILAKNGWAHASADSSDGIHQTISQICEVSGVGAELFWNEFPIADGVEDFAEDTDLELEDLILRAGEEFLHIYIIPQDHVQEVTDYFEKQNKPFYRIGIIIEGKDKILLKDELEQDTVLLEDRKGFEHFKK